MKVSEREKMREHEFQCACMCTFLFKVNLKQTIVMTDCLGNQKNYVNIIYAELTAW